MAQLLDNKLDTLQELYSLRASLSFVYEQQENINTALKNEKNKIMELSNSTTQQIQDTGCYDRDDELDNEITEDPFSNIDYAIKQRKSRLEKKPISRLRLLLLIPFYLLRLLEFANLAFSIFAICKYIVAICKYVFETFKIQYEITPFLKNLSSYILLESHWFNIGFGRVVFFVLTLLSIGSSFVLVTDGFHSSFYSIKWFALEPLYDNKDRELNYDRLKLLQDKKDSLSASIYSIQAETDKYISPYIALVDTTMQILEYEYSEILDKRDWKYIDYIIYLFETRRADNIPQALQQVDAKKMNDNIITAITTANENICSNLQFGFNSINSKLIAINASIVASINATYAQNTLLMQTNNNISKLISAQQMQNALISQANVDSYKMVESINKLQSTVANESFKIRNGIHY